MIDAITQPFIEFSFMRRALVGCLALSLGAPPIGVFLMLRRMSLMGDAMSHAILPGAAIGYLLAGLSLFAMSLGGFAAGLAVALSAGLIARSTVLREDASLAAFYLVSLALGVLIVSVRGSNIDLLHVLFGTVLALDDQALLLVASISTLSLLVLAVIYRPLVLECFDPQFLRSTSDFSSPTYFNFLVLVVLNLVSGFQALGTLMAVGIMLLPAVTARFWADDVSGLILVAILVAFAASLTGVLLSYYANVPTGPRSFCSRASSISSRSWSARKAGSYGASCRANIWKPDLLSIQGASCHETSHHRLDWIGIAHAARLCRRRKRGRQGQGRRLVLDPRRYGEASGWRSCRRDHPGRSQRRRACL